MRKGLSRDHSMQVLFSYFFVKEAYELSRPGDGVASLINVTPLRHYGVACLYSSPSQRNQKPAKRNTSVSVSMFLALEIFCAREVLPVPAGYHSA